MGMAEACQWGWRRPATEWDRMEYEKRESLPAFPFFSGAAEESRTLDLNLGKVALYQLSYCRNFFALPGRPCGTAGTAGTAVFLERVFMELPFLIPGTAIPGAAIPGAAEESRTLDLNLGKVALYQLSYCRPITTTTTTALLLPVCGGASRSRTDLHGFAIRCITALLSRQSMLFTTGKAVMASPEILERQKSLELSTSTLARLRSTN